MLTLPDFIARQLELGEPASDDAIRNLKEYVGPNLPLDYLTFLEEFNGATGRGPNLHIELTRAEEVPKLDEASGIKREIATLLAIGGDGCGGGLAIDTAAEHVGRPYVWYDPLELGEAMITKRASSLLALFELLDHYYST